MGAGIVADGLPADGRSHLRKADRPLLAAFEILQADLAAGELLAHDHRPSSSRLCGCLELLSELAVARIGANAQAGRTKLAPNAEPVRVVFARAEKGGDRSDVDADRKDFGDLGRGGIRLQAALCALELLLPVEDVAP